jgi:Secretion system C-terminal sorting domain
MTRLLLALCLCACAISLNAQDCTPDPQYADSTAGVYPKPYDAATNTGVGITECAVIGQNFQFNLTVVINDSLTIGTTSYPLDSIVISQVTGLPVGMTYSCDPANCHFLKNTLSCASIYGIPTGANAPGAYDMVIKGSAYINGSSFPLPLEFPNPLIAPGKYTIYLNANANDPCAATATKNLEGQVSITTLPNPTAGIAQIKINSQLNGQFQLRVVDLLGKRIEQRQVSIPTGENQFELEASHLPNGLYLLQLQNEKGFVTQKLAVQH